MNDLSPEDRAFLDLARDADDPSSAQRERTRLRLAAKLGIAAGTLSASAAAPAAASTTATSMGVATVFATSGAVAVKIAAIVAVVSASAGGVAIYRSSRAPSPPAASMSTKSASPLLAAPTQARVVTVAAVPPPEMSPAPTETTARTAPVEVAALPAPVETAAPLVPAPRARAAPRPAAPASTEETSTATLEDETRLVRTGVAALRAGDPASALTLLDEHARGFPQGVLAEERAAERVLALCALGREAEARAAADRFLREHPSAPLAGKVRGSCGSESLDSR